MEDTLQLDAQDTLKLDWKVKREGDRLMVSPKVDKTVNEVLSAQIMINTLIDVLKTQGQVVIENNGSGILSGNNWSMFIQQPSLKISPYSINKKVVDKKYCIEVTKLLPLDEEIEDYFNKHGEYPEGVTRREQKPVVKILRG